MAFTQITGDPLNVVAPGWQLLASATASASATIDFDSGIDFSNWDVVVVTMSDVDVSVDNSSPRWRCSSDGGSTYDSGASDYSYSLTGLQSSTEVNVSNTTTAAFLTNGATAGVGFDADEGFCGQLFFHNMNSTTNKMRCVSHIFWESTSGQASFNVGGGMRNSTAAMNGIQIFMGSGNFTIGEFKLYGVA